MMFKKLLPLLLSLVLALAGQAALAAERMVIATAGTAGALYPMGVAMAETINAHGGAVKASAEASAASLENLRNLATGEVDWGISQNEMAWLAYNGQGKFAGHAIPGLRSLFGTIISWVQVFVPADSPVVSIDQLRGKRVGLGAPGSGGEQAARMVLESYGLTYHDLKAEFMGNVDMVGALKDGSLDAFFITHPLKSAPLLDLASSKQVRLLPVDLPAFYQKHPYYTKRMVPAGSYPGQTADVPTATSRVVMYTMADSRLGAAKVRALLEVLWKNSAQWTGVHPAVKRYTSLADALAGLAVPLHPGAVAFYRAQGMEVPARLVKD